MQQSDAMKNAPDHRAVTARWVVGGTVTLILAATLAPAADWPMWRHDPQRTAATAEDLPGQPTLQWVRELGTPAPIWEMKRFQMTRNYQPVAAGKSIFVP